MKQDDNSMGRDAGGDVDVVVGSRLKSYNLRSTPRDNRLVSYIDLTKIYETTEAEFSKQIIPSFREAKKRLKRERYPSKTCDDFDLPPSQLIFFACRKELAEKKNGYSETRPKATSPKLIDLDFGDWDRAEAEKQEKHRAKKQKSDLMKKQPRLDHSMARNTAIPLGRPSINRRHDVSMFKADYREKMRREREGNQNATASFDQQNNSAEFYEESFQSTSTSSSWNSVGLEEHQPTTSSSNIDEGASKWWLESPTRPIRRCSHGKRVSFDASADLVYNSSHDY